MSAVNNINVNNQNLNKIFEVQNKEFSNSNVISPQDEFVHTEPLKKVNYEKIGDGLSRPINVDSSNNTFFINHNDQNKAVKIEAGEYNLRELQAALQKKVNENFGIGKLSLKLTASGSDRFIYAEDKKEEHVLDEQA